MPPDSQKSSVGFEALLKPLQDVCCKNWEVTLTEYLEEFLEHLRVQGRDDSATNFSEAALLLQNCSSFYSKRVDMLFGFMTNLIDTLQRCRGGDDPNGKEETSNTQKKKSNKGLKCEGLEALDFVFSDHIIDMKKEKQLKVDPEKRSIVLNMSMKVLPKPDTSYLLYVKENIDYGYKDEYRLNWRISSDGLLQEDFSNGGQEKNLVLRKRRDDMEAFDDLREEDMDTSHDMDVPEIGALEMGSIPVEDLPEEQPLFMPDDSREEENDPNRNNSLIPPVNESGDIKKKDDPWEPIMFNFNFNILKFNKKRAFRLPKSILTSIEKKRQREEQDKDSLLSNNDTYLYYSTLLGRRGPLNPVEFRYEKENSRKNLILMRRKLGRRNVREAGRACDEDFLGFSPREEEDLNDTEFGGADDNCNNDDDDNYSIMPIPELDVGNVAVRIPIETREERDKDAPGDTYERDAHFTMQKYKESKRENATMATKVAQRVAAWHESIQPVLDAAEKRSAFDIQEYGTRILNKFQETPNEEPVLSFKEIASGVPKEEICRYFLSTLALTNTYNLEIRKTSEGDLVKDCLEVKLLSRVRHHEELDDNLREAAKDCGY